ncbi:MAG: hypothetical protein MJE68_10395, partial [Proteobacteria bacterium]|nr:hypothetical protein [Pseudomonadota bacterium]
MRRMPLNHLTADSILAYISPIVFAPLTHTFQPAPPAAKPRQPALILPLLLCMIFLSGCGGGGGGGAA